MSNSHHQFGGVCRDEIVLWVRKQTGFAVTTIQGKDEAEFFLSQKVTAVLGYFDKLEVSLTQCQVMLGLRLSFVEGCL